MKAGIEEVRGDYEGRSQEPDSTPLVRHHEGPYVGQSVQLVGGDDWSEKIDFFYLQADSLEQQLQATADLIALTPKWELTEGLDLQQPQQHVRLEHVSRQDLLRYLGDRWGLQLRVEGRLLQVAGRVQRTFDIAALPGATSQSLSDSSSALRLGGGSSTLQSSGGRGDLGLVIGDSWWEELRELISNESSGRAQVEVLKDLAVVRVVAPVRDMPRIEQVIADLNDRLQRQVAIEVRLLQVQLEDVSEAGIDWGALQREVNHTDGVNVRGGLSREAQFSIEVTPDANNPPDLSIDAVIGAFSRQGDVEILTSPRGVTLNHQLMRVALLTQTSYLAQTTTSEATLGTSSTSGLVPGVVESGFTLLLVPSIRKHDVLLQLSVNIASLDDIETVSSGDQSIQVPTLVESRFLHRVRVRSGDTLVLGGVRELRSDVTSNRWGLHRRSLNRRVERVLLLTPQILGPTSAR